MKKVFILLALLVLVLAAGGCWDRREINDLGLVVGVATDLVENPDGEPLVEVTLQVIRHTAATVGPGVSGGMGGAGQGAKPFWTISETSKTIRSAIVKMNYKTPKELFLGHVRVNLIGEKAARSGSAPFFDRFMRSRESRGTCYVVVSKGEAKDILEQETPVFGASALALNDIFKAKDGTQAIMSVNINGFSYRLNSGVICPLAPVVEVVPETSLTSLEKKSGGGKNTLRVSGLAAFSQDGKLVDFFNERETLGLMWVLNKVKNREITVQHHAGGTNEPITLGVYKSKSSIAVSQGENGRPAFEVKVKAYCDLLEQFGSQTGMSDENFIESVAQEAGDQIALEIGDAVKKAQQINTDVFGFAEELRRRHRRDWFALKESWKEIFPEVSVTVEPEVSIRHRGLTVEPPSSRREEAPE